MNWRLESFRVDLTEGPTETDDGVRFGVVSDHFAIYGDHGWHHLTHRASGQRLGKYDSRDAALAAAARLETLQDTVVDWSLPEPTMPRDVDQREAIKALL